MRCKALEDVKGKQWPFQKWPFFEKFFTETLLLWQCSRKVPLEGRDFWFFIFLVALAG